MTTQCEKYLKASELLTDLISDVFSIIELGFGKEMAEQLYDDFIIQEEESACCASDAVILEKCRQDFEYIKKAVTMLGKIHGFE